MKYKRLKDLREDHDRTPTELRRSSHCRQRGYGAYVRGDLDIPTPILIALADYYNVSVDYILERTDNPTLTK